MEVEVRVSQNNIFRIHLISMSHKPFLRCKILPHCQFWRIRLENRFFKLFNNDVKTSFIGEDVLYRSQMNPNRLFLLYCILSSTITSIWPRGGRPATPFSSPSHILLIFSSEPPLNPRPFNIIF